MIRCPEGHGGLTIRLVVDCAIAKIDDGVIVPKVRSAVVDEDATREHLGMTSVWCDHCQDWYTESEIVEENTPAT